MIQNYHFKGEDSIVSPALIYYKDTIIENTKKAIQISGSPDRLWPHVKSHKSKDFTQLQTELGITSFKCATISEAEMTAQTDAKRILLAYPLVGPAIERFVRLAMAYPSKVFYALSDNLEQLSLLGSMAVQHNICVNTLIDVNTGMNRTGIVFSDIVPFYKEMTKIPGIAPCGLHCYDGERHEKEYLTRQGKVQDTISTILSIRKELELQNIPCPVVIMGGSPTFPCYAGHMEDTYYSPGTVFLYDAGYQEQFPDLPYTPGAAILTRVVSHPQKGIFTVDTGYKSISAEQGIRGKLLEVPHAREAFQSEEHWTFQMMDGFEDERPAIGSVLYIIPWHVCPTSALHQKAYVISEGELSCEWMITARNRMLTY